jgi:3-methyladenine DNA glycosylase AlkD
VLKRTERGSHAWQSVDTLAPEFTLLKTLQRLINAIVWTPRILFVWLLLCFLNEEPDAGARRSREHHAKEAAPMRPDLATGDRMTLQ